MKRRMTFALCRRAIVVLWPGLLVGALGVTSASAHHAFTAQYDPDSTAELSGVVIKIDWLNPHAYFYVDVTDDHGDVVTWACELTSPVGLMRRGWTRNSLAIGDVVSVSGALARDGSPSLNVGTVVLASTGRELFGRSREEERQAGLDRPVPAESPSADSESGQP